MNSKLKEIFGPNFSIGDIDFGQSSNNMSFLTIQSLESSALFKTLKQELEKFYIERKRSLENQTLHKGKSREWKEHFYNALQTLLNEVTFTSSSDIKAGLLNKIHKWYMEKTGISPFPKSRGYEIQSGQGKEDLGILILQGIEPTTPVKLITPSPYLPNKIQYDLEENPSNKCLFKALLKTENQSNPINLPKVKKIRTKDNFFRPYSPSKPAEVSPLIKDFRAKSTAFSRNPSPDTFRNTSYMNQSLYENPVFQNFSAVPPRRRSQIKEIMKIKKKLASRKVICPVKVLETGLMFSDFTQEAIPPESFPKGGELLMQSPYEKKGPTRKKRKTNKKKEV